MNRAERRGQVRAVGEQGTVEVLAVAYGVVDDYGSLWVPGVFTKSLAQRMPTFAWAHSWDEPIGRGIDSREDPAVGQYVTLRLDLDDDVPRARQAYKQMQSGTLDDVSVGFWPRDVREPTDDERRDYPGVREVIVEADLDEVSVVLRGAVPGAKVGSVRDARGQVVPEDAVVSMAKKVAAGEMSEAEAKVALNLLGSDDGTDEQPGEEDAETGDADDAEAALAEADAALEAVTDRGRR